MKRPPFVLWSAVLVAALAVIISAGLLGCAPPSRHDGAGGATGGAGGSGGNAGDAGGQDKGGSDGGAGACTPGMTFCDGSGVVRECMAGGKPGSVVEACGGGSVCSAGRCTSAACAAAEVKASVVGCLFYAADTDNTELDDPQVYGFPIGNTTSTPATVTIERKTSAGTWESMMSGPVASGQINYFRIAEGIAKGKDFHIEGSGLEAKAYRIKSDAPVVAYQINADDENMASYSSGSTLLVPAHALGFRHYALLPPERGVAKTGGYPLSLPMGPDKGFVTVVATRDQTHVHLVATAHTMAGGKVPALAPGGAHDAILDEGDVLQIESDGPGNDLSGSEVTSDKPVAVFAGNTCGGFDPKRLDNCDHIEEQMYPVGAWGKSFVPLDMRMPEHGPSKNIWLRLVASEDDTTVTFDAAATLPGMPTAPVTLKKGQVLPVEIAYPLKADKTETRRAHMTVTATRPIAIESFMGEEEGGAIVIPVDQFLDDYLVSTHPWFTGFLLVTRKAGTPVTVDGAPVPASAFVPAGGGFEVAYLPAERCEKDLTRCAHRIVGSGVGVTVTANGGTCNYCYAGGAGAVCINRTAGCR